MFYVELLATSSELHDNSRLPTFLSITRFITRDIDGTFIFPIAACQVVRRLHTHTSNSAPIFSFHPLILVLTEDQAQLWDLDNEVVFAVAHETRPVLSRRKLNAVEVAQDVNNHVAHLHERERAANAGEWPKAKSGEDVVLDHLGLGIPALRNKLLGALVALLGMSHGPERDDDGGASWNVGAIDGDSLGRGEARVARWNRRVETERLVNNTVKMLGLGDVLWIQDLLALE